ncbi:MAG: hypothetical protein KBF41_08595, partial [Azonexus sp.]|nr:hypothetical protein [Azonexus sp.]MBP9228148.1 hypothetical protein [Azonexus sp.]
YANLIPSHRFSPSVIDRLATSVYRIEAVATCHPIYSSLGTQSLLPESFETYQIVRPADIVFRLTDLQNDKRSLRTAIVKELGIITSAYLAAKPTGIQAHYLSYLLRAYDVTKVFYSMGGGLRQSMKFADIKRLPTLVPPVAEQTAIATFLDRETAKIDGLIAEQEKLIALLKERRSALISAAVTGKIDVRHLAEAEAA